MKGIHPSRWQMCEVVEVKELKARVVPRFPDGRLDVHSTYFITPYSQRAIVIGVDGMFFSDKTIDTEPGEIRVGSLVIVELREGHSNVYGWTLRDYYRSALDIYDTRYSSRVLSYVERRFQRPDEVRYPNRPYSDRVPAPVVPFGKIGGDLSLSAALAAAPVVALYPDDPEFERSLTDEEVVLVKSMSKFARKQFRNRKLASLVTA